FRISVSSPHRGPVFSGEPTSRLPRRFSADFAGCGGVVVSFSTAPTRRKRNRFAGPTVGERDHETGRALTRTEASDHRRDRGQTPDATRPTGRPRLEDED